MRDETPPPLRHRCVFFDRDGVVNRSPGEGYVLRREEFHLNPGIPEALRWLKDRGWLALLATSQKCVGKGLLSRTELDRIHAGMQQELLLRGGAAFDGIYCHTGEPGEPHPAKPDPGMLFAASRDHGIELGKSWMVGDADRDIAMAQAAGLLGTLRVLGEKPAGVEATGSVRSTLEIVNFFGNNL